MVADESRVPGRRRLPVQERSRRRVQQMVDAARSIIIEQGSDALRMSDVASAADVSIGSLYQYFPDKTSLIATMAQRFYEESRSCVEDALGDVRGRDDFAEAIRWLAREYYRLFREDPAMLDIWSGMQADQVLRDLDGRENAEIGRLIADTLLRVDTTLQETTAMHRGLLLSTTIAANVMLATAMPVAEGAAIIDELDAMLGRLLAA